MSSNEVKPPYYHELDHDSESPGFDPSQGSDIHIQRTDDDSIIMRHGRPGSESLKDAKYNIDKDGTVTDKRTGEVVHEGNGRMYIPTDTLIAREDGSESDK